MQVSIKKLYWHSLGKKAGQARSKLLRLLDCLSVTQLLLSVSTRSKHATLKQICFGLAQPKYRQLKTAQNLKPHYFSYLILIFSIFLEFLFCKSF